MRSLILALLVLISLLGCNAPEGHAALTYVSSGGPSNGIRIQGLAGYTYALRFSNTYNLIGSRVTSSGGSVDLYGADFQGRTWTSGTACKVEIYDPSGVLIEKINYPAGLTAGSIYSHTLQTMTRPLQQQTFLQGESIPIVINAAPGATVSCTVGGGSASIAYSSGAWRGNFPATGLVDAVTVTATVNGANTSKTIYVYNSTDLAKKEAFEIGTWLRTAWVNDPWGGQLIKERYDIATDSWDWLDVMGGGIWMRPDCNHETMLFFGRLYQLTGQTTFLTMARNIFTEIAHLQRSDKLFWFYYTSTGLNPSNLIYTNDNSEVVITCMEMAEIDTANAAQYQQRALEVAEALRLSYQNATTGGFRINNANSINNTPPHFTSHGLAALCRVYPLLTGSTKTTYRLAIEKGLAFLNTQIQSSGRMKCNLEYDGINEGIRPPTSDHFIAIRAYAFAEKYVGADSANLSQWQTDRRKMLSFVPTVTHSSGAILNGTGVHWSDNNSANLTDFVYVNYFALISLRLSAELDNSATYLAWHDNLLAFCKANLHRSDIAEVNGIYRGSYNLLTQSYDTIQETPTFASDPELGGNIVYSGWSGAPIAMEITTPVSLAGTVTGPAGSYAANARCSSR